MAEYVTVAKLSEVPPGEMKSMELEGEAVVIANVNGEVFAFGGECTHVGGPLGEGTLADEIVECPWHGGRFNVRSGAVVGPPPQAAVPTYAVRVEGDAIQIARR